MPTDIEIKEIPDDLFDKLKSQAKLHQRSIESEVILILTKATQSSKSADPQKIITTAKKLREKAKGSLTINQIQKAFEHR